MYLKIGKKIIMWRGLQANRDPILKNLFSAIRDNDLTKIEYLVKELGEPNIFGTAGYQKAEKNRGDSHGLRHVRTGTTHFMLPLVYALRWGTEESVELLLKAGANPNLISFMPTARDFIKSPVFLPTTFAVIYGILDMKSNSMDDLGVEKLNKLLPYCTKQTINTIDPNGSNILHHLARSAQYLDQKTLYPCIDKLVAMGINLNQANCDGEIPLIAGKDEGCRQHLMTQQNKKSLAKLIPQATDDTQSTNQARIRV